MRFNNDLTVFFSNNQMMASDTFFVHTYLVFYIIVSRFWINTAYSKAFALFKICHKLLEFWIFQIQFHIITKYKLISFCIIQHIWLVIFQLTDREFQPEDFSSYNIINAVHFFVNFSFIFRLCKFFTRFQN